MSTQESQVRSGNGQGSTPMGTEDFKQLQNEVKSLEVAQAGQAAMIAGAEATQAATQAGTWTTMMAGAGGLILGLFLGISIVKVARQY
jgi:hypothetical protein